MKKHFSNGLPQVVKRQHYIPVKYLDAWKNGKRIAVCALGSQPKMVGLRDVAVRSCFYELMPLNYVELNTILDCIDIDDSYIRRVITSFFAASVVTQIAGRFANDIEDIEAKDMMTLLRSKRLWDEHADLVLGTRYLATIKNPSVAINGYERFRRNGIETILTGIENAAWPYISRLLDGKDKFLQDSQEAIPLIEYIFLQMYRTPKLDAIFSQSAKVSGESPDVAKSMLPYLRVVFAVQAARRVVKNIDNYELVLLCNDSDTNFITSDYPFVHLEDVLDSEFVFPISPKYAIYFGVKGNLNTQYRFLLDISHDLVKKINGRIANSSVEQIFGRTISELKYGDVLKYKNIPLQSYL